MCEVFADTLRSEPDPLIKDVTTKEKKKEEKKVDEKKADEKKPSVIRRKGK